MINKHLMFALVLVASLANASVSFDASSNAHSGSSTPNLSWATHNVGTGANRLIVIGCATEAANQTISSVTVGGVSATFFRRDAIGGGSWATGNLEYWYLISPASGNGVSIVVTPTATPTAVSCGAISYAGATQTTPLRNAVMATGTTSGSNVATINIASNSADMVMAIASCGWNLTPSLSNASGTERWSIANNANYSAGQTASGSGSVTTSWSVGSGSGGWTITGVDIQAAASTGTTYYISTVGSDHNDGKSPQTAWVTFDKADIVATSGDTVRVLSGTYYLGVQGQSGDCIHTHGAGVTYTSDVKWGAKLVCQAGAGNNAIWVIEADNEVVRWFDLTTNNQQHLGLIVYSDAPVHGNNVQILENHVHDIPFDGTCSGFGDGISVQVDGLTGIVIDRNLVNNIGPYATASCPPIMGITTKGPVTVTNNVVYHASGWGIETHCCVGGAIVVNNTVFNNTRGGIVVDNVTNDIISNNIVYKNGTLDTKACGLDARDSGIGTTTYTKNLLFGNAPANYCEQDVSKSTPTGQITADPVFVNYQGDGTGNYHLSSTSPAIDAGTSSNGPGLDYDGISRPEGCCWDIGAYEYVPR